MDTRERILRIAIRVAKAPPPKLYHATLAASKIVKEGFKLGVGVGFGGSSEGKYISFTTKENVKNYLEGMRDKIRAARGEYSVEDVRGLFKKWGMNSTGEYQEYCRAYHRGGKGDLDRVISKFRKVDEDRDFGEDYWQQFMSYMFHGRPIQPKEKIKLGEDSEEIPVPKLTKDEEIDLLVSVVHSISVSSMNNFPWILTQGNDRVRWGKFQPSDVGVVEVTLKPGVKVDYHSGEEEWRIYDPNDVATIKLANL